MRSPYNKKDSLAFILQKCVLTSTLKASRCQVSSRKLCVEWDVWNKLLKKKKASSKKQAKRSIKFFTYVWICSVVSLFAISNIVIYCTNCYKYMWSIWYKLRNWATRGLLESMYLCMFIFMIYDCLFHVQVKRLWKKYMLCIFCI